MNYDDMLERDRELAEGAGDLPHKIWLVFVKGGFNDCFVSLNEEGAEIEFDRLKTFEKELDIDTIEMGYVWDVDYTPGNLVRTYQYLESTKIYKNESR